MTRLDEEVIRLFQDPDARKALATVDENGTPHVAFKESLTVLESGEIAYAEELESSKVNKNMVRSIWFHKKIAVSVAKKGVTYSITGRPYKCVVTGPLLKQFLLQAREVSGPEADVQSVWLIIPEQVRNETLSEKLREEREKRPFFNRHLDQESLRIVTGS